MIDSTKFTHILRIHQFQEYGNVIADFTHFKIVQIGVVKFIRS